MTYYPSGHDDVLFGGEGFNETSDESVFYQDTWSFANHAWSEVIDNTSCTNTTCPSARAGAMIAYYPTDNALILFGGFIIIPIPPFIRTVAYNDTWEYSDGTWTNITASAGAAPPARFEGAMSYDPSDDDILLFGGSDADGYSLGDTWEFASGTWTNITASEGGSTGWYATVPSEPSPRAAAAIAYSPSGYVLLFGGEITSTTEGPAIIENDCNGQNYTDFNASAVAWWFYQGKWTVMGGWAATETGACTPPPPPVPAQTHPAVTPDASGPVANPPCGRQNAALGWSPQNNRFVLYGGIGPLDQGLDGACPEPASDLNDTWLYQLPGGGGYQWAYAGDSGDPTNRSGMGYASDFTDGYFEIFGGTNPDSVYFGSTWRFYELVHAQLTGPSVWDTAESLHLVQTPFYGIGYGGSGDLEISFVSTALKVKTNNLDSGTGCGWLYNGSSDFLPYSGVLSFLCEPDASSYNVYRITETVVDYLNGTDRATANWIFTVEPPEAENIYSQYVGNFYQGIALENRFTIVTEVNGDPANQIVASINGVALSFSRSTGDPDMWNATVNMGQFGPGNVNLVAESFVDDWTQNATYLSYVVGVPGWLQSVINYPGSTQTIQSFGAPGSFNQTYTVHESYGWDLSSLLGFSIPVELVGGDYGLIPSINVTVSLASSGDLTISGSIPINVESIDIGVGSIAISCYVNVSGTLTIGDSGVQWVSADAIFKIGGFFNASIPIYGFSILGVDVGFYLDISVSASVALELLLAPASSPSKDMLSNLELEIQGLIGVFSLGIAASVNFGIGIASIGLGLGISVALSMWLDPDVSISNIWVNGSIFVTASFLWWSDSWNIVSGNIYHGDPPGPDGAIAPDAYEASYNNNGTGSQWVTQPRYYDTGAYDGYTWTGVATTGAAITDIYPYTSVAGASAYNGDDFFYTYDNTSLPESAGLEIAVAHLDSTSNELTPLPVLNDPGYYEIANPHATTLPDGNLYVTWAGLPNSEADVNSPLNLTTLNLQGATFYPNNASWGPITTFTHAEFAESYQVDATAADPTVVVLEATAPLIGDTTPESLLEFNLTTGALAENISVTGYSEVASLRSASELVALQGLDGNYTLLNLANSEPIALDVSPPTGYVLTSASFVQGSTTELALLYRGGNGSEAVLYNAAGGTAVYSTSLGQDTFEAEAIESGATYYVFLRTSSGILGFTESGGAFAPLTTIVEPEIETYGLAQIGNTIVVYSIAVTGGNATDPIKSLFLDEIGASLPPVPVPAAARTSTSPTSSASPDYLLYLGIIVAAVVLLLAVVFVATRRRGPPPPLHPYEVPQGANAGPSPPPPTDPPGG